MLYITYAIIVLFLASSIIIIPQTAYSQGKSFTVKVDEPAYAIGQIIHVSGTVPVVIEDTPVIMQIFDPGNVLYTELQKLPNGEGIYSFEFEIGDKNAALGVYTVKATYFVHTAQTKFHLYVPVLELKDMGEVWHLNASLTNGDIKQIEVDKDSTSIIVKVHTIDNDGAMTITLPRELIDAKKNNDEDGQFIVLVDDRKAEFNEVSANQTERTLRINVPAQSGKVEIIGTQVIPEFPFNLMMAITAATVVMLFATRFTNVRSIKRG